MAGSTTTLNEKRNELLRVLTSSLSTSGVLAKETTLELIRILLDDSTGGDGTEFIFGTGAVTAKNYKYIVANEDTTFTALVGSTTADLKTDLGITTNTVGKGMIIKGYDGETITEITLATGSVIGIL